MNEERKQKRKHGILQRLFAALGVCTILITTLLVLIFEISAIFIAVYAAALAAIIGPVFTEGASGFIEIVTGIAELIFEGILTVFELITSLFSGF